MLSPTPHTPADIPGPLGFSFPKKFSAWITKSVGKSQVPELQVAGQCKVVQARVTQYFFFFLLIYYEPLSHTRHTQGFVFPVTDTHNMTWSNLLSLKYTFLFSFPVHEPESEHFRTWVSNWTRGSTKLPDSLAPSWSGCSTYLHLKCQHLVLPRWSVSQARWQTESWTCVKSVVTVIHHQSPSVNRTAHHQQHSKRDSGELWDHSQKTGILDFHLNKPGFSWFHRSWYLVRSKGKGKVAQQCGHHTTYGAWRGTRQE